MKLKEVEIIGFKSFLKKTVVNFENEITAVVGPNGSGKSNISDAIRWALGEQSIKSLRGSRMEDVIFSGTEKRKALGYCEVTVTFDNRSGQIPIEYEEVAFTRRVFRSGESEYYINKNSCRLKDIRELIVDTGIGKEGYSIIGQGRIDEILSDRPEDRRGIFEEAAGIVRFKNKKIESERKLKRTEENLTRIGDILSELSRREKKLEGQAKKARKYEELYRSLEDIEISLIVGEINKSKGDLDRNRLKVEALDKELGNYLHSLKFNRLREGLAKNKLRTYEVGLENLNRSRFDLINQSNSRENTFNLLEEQEKYSKKDLSRLEKEIVSLEGQIDSARLVRKGLRAKEEDYKTRSSFLEKEFIEEEEGFIKNDKFLKSEELDIETKNKEYFSHYEEFSRLKSSISGDDSLILNLEIRKSEIEKNISLKKEEVQALEVKKSQLENSLEEARALYAERTDFLGSLDLEIKNLSQERESLKEKIQATQIDLEKNIASLRLYKNMEASYEGYYRGVKAALKARDKDFSPAQGLVGSVAELISVKVGYEEAISTALGSRGQNLVTLDQKSAKSLIEYLRNNRLGRVTCLPRDTIKARPLSIRKEDYGTYNILGMASELVEYREENRNIVEDLLGRTIVVSNMDSAIKLSNAYKNSLRIVTSQGDIINPGGSMTGGSQDKSSNMFTRKNKIELLESTVNKLKNNYMHLTGELNSLDEKLGDKTQEFKLKSKELDSLNLELVTLEGQVKNNELNLERSKKEEAFEEELLLSNLNKIDEINRRLLKTKEELKILDLKLVEFKSQAEKDTCNLEKLREKRDRARELLVEKKLAFSNISKDLKSVSLEIEENLGQTKSWEKLIEIKENEILKLKEVIDQSSSEKQLLNTELKDLEIKKSKIQTGIFQVEEKIELCRSKISDLNKEKEIISSRLDMVLDKKRVLEIENAKLGLNLKSSFENLRQDYNLNYRQGLAHKKEIGDIIEARKSVDSLKKEIEGLGNINLGSIKEYEELSSRLKFMTNQKNDLVKAKKDLHKVIRGIEAKMRSRFKESFDRINENFKGIFKELFNGGRANLVLCDKEDLLNSGIEIEVEPPGKKLQNLNLLSGGEKSLTAVTLLFAILKMKPSPFCILDEIDAALDEANIGRYTRYLKSISNNTQFIIITHRKRTMEMADMLYGVTMEEEGVSKLLSLELKDFNKYENILE